MPLINSYATVIFADIQGYTALMEQNESSGIAVLEYFIKNMRKSVSDHDGRIVHFWGDGCLALFDNADDAMVCCIQLQLEFQRDPIVPVRIGMNCGDVIQTDCNAYGCAVNISSRLESICLAGAILLTDCVKNDISQNNVHKLLRLGNVDFKNNEGIVEVYAVDNTGLVVPDPVKFSSKYDKVRAQRKFLRSPQWMWKSLGISFCFIVWIINLIYSL